MKTAGVEHTAGRAAERVNMSHPTSFYEHGIQM